MSEDKLHPDAESALRKLILEIWGFQIETEDTEESNQKFNSIWQTADIMVCKNRFGPIGHTNERVEFDRKTQRFIQKPPKPRLHEEMSPKQAFFESTGGRME